MADEDTLIRLGYEVPGGAQISIPLGHMAVTGQTQQSGKTTTLEALITRSGLRAIAFITKRGERGFESGRHIPPYFEERSDWEYVSGILESLRHEKMKFERAWIVRACKGARTLEDVQANVRRLGEETKSAMSQDMYMLLGEYLSKVVPAIKLLPKVDRVDLQPGLNVMDLTAYPPELQMLVVASTIQWIYQHEDETVTIIPECWKFVPQGISTPVKKVVENLIREGGGLSNFIWLDSQDMAGVDKLMLRSSRVWLIGVQREANEIKRALENIPAGVKKPKKEQLAKLRKGEFFACWGEDIHHVYVQPPWLGEDEARLVAQRESEIRPRPRSAGSDEAIEHAGPTYLLRIEGMVKDLRQEFLERINRASDNGDRPAAPPLDLDEIYEYVIKRLRADGSALLDLKDVRPALQLTIDRPVMSVDTGSLRGRIAKLITENFFTSRRNSKQVMRALQEHAWSHKAETIMRELEEMTSLGFFRKQKASDRTIWFELQPGVQVNVKER